MPKLTDLEIKGKTIAVYIDDRGQFTANIDPEVTIHADTLEKLKENVTRGMTVKAAKIDIRAIRWQGAEMEHGSFTGVHAANGNYLWKVDGKKGVEQIWDSHASDFLPEEPECVKQYQTLCETAEKAVKARNDFERKHHIDIRAVISAALNKVAKS
jgi:hypothetical protein